LTDFHTGIEGASERSADLARQIQVSGRDFFQ
jgi:hypothetical protein